MIRFVFYTAVSAVYWYTWVFDTKLFADGKYKKVGFPHDDSFCGRAKFLTYNTMGVLTFYFTYGAILSLGQFVSSLFGGCDNCESSNNNTCVFKRFQNFLYISVAFPFGMLVVFSFWSNYYIDRDLVYPLILDSIIPSWVNHVMHTLPLALVLENFLTPHSYPSSLWKGIWPGIVCAVVYISWVNYIYLQSGKWVYGIMRTLETPYRELYQASTVLTLCLFYKLGQYLNGRLEKPVSQPISTNKKKN